MAILDVSVTDALSLSDSTVSNAGLQALITFQQGSTGGVGGEALIGIAGQPVSIVNYDNSLVASWQIDLLYVPQGSALSAVTPLAFSNNSSTPFASFTPDISGSYRLQLTVWGSSNRTGSYNKDIRVFSIRESGRGLIVPPAQLWPQPLPPLEKGSAN